MSKDAYTLLSSLGISFDREIDISLSPEECIISLLVDFELLNNRRHLSLAILAFQEYQDYFRPDLFDHLARELPYQIQMGLGGIIFRERLRNPGRWNNLKKLLSSNLISKQVFIDQKKLVTLRGSDPGFAAFNLMMTPVAKSDPKKLFLEDMFLRQNQWFANRLFFGTTSRADIVTIRRNHLEATPYRIAKRFNCSIPSITKTWNDLIRVQELGFF